MTKPRREVMLFTSLMEEVLRENEHKGHWKDCTMPYLVERLNIYQRLMKLSALSIAKGKVDKNNYLIKSAFFDYMHKDNDTAHLGDFITELMDILEINPEHVLNKCDGKNQRLRRRQMSKPRYECEVCKKVFVNADEKNNCLKSHKMPRLSTYQWAKGNPYPSTIVASFVVGEKIMDVRYRVESITENICGCGDHIVHYPGEPDIQCKCGAWICHTCAVLGRKCECGEYIEIEPAGSHTWRMRRREDIEQD